MEIGIFSQPDTVDKAVEHAKLFSDAGFGSYWMPQIFGLDTLTALTVVAREVPNVRLGTAVVPTYPRHPAMLAAQARTLQQVADGRFTLGIGLSHQMVIEGMFGMTFEKPVRHLREYLSILMPLLNGEAADFDGETLHGHSRVHASRHACCCAWHANAERHGAYGAGNCNLDDGSDHNRFAYRTDDQ